MSNSIKKLLIIHFVGELPIGEKAKGFTDQGLKTGEKKENIFAF